MILTKWPCGGSNLTVVQVALVLENGRLRHCVMSTTSSWSHMYLQYCKTEKCCCKSSLIYIFFCTVECSFWCVSIHHNSYSGKLSWDKLSLIYNQCCWVNAKNEWSSLWTNPFMTILCFEAKWVIIKMQKKIPMLYFGFPIDTFLQERSDLERVSLYLA